MSKKDSSHIVNQYQEPDVKVIFNGDDKDLDTIEYRLPECPDYREIDGYGLSPKDQFFKVEPVPYKIIELQDEIDPNGQYLTQDEIWVKINRNVDYYKSEIEYMRKQWERRLYGYWFFCNGKPTYIDGWHYFYLCFWQLPEGLPEYRDRDRKFFHFARMTYRDKTMYGMIYPKHRREGATSKSSCILYAIATLLIRGRVGIQSMTDKAAEDVFQKHIIPGWRNMPFFFRANSSTSDDPKKSLLFSSHITKGKLGTKTRSRKSLQTDISFRASGVKAFDGTQLWGVIQDEVGKLLECNINDRWRTIKLCLSKGGGSRIHGWAICTSTVGEMESGGGQNMRDLCEGSKYSVRNKNDQTATGLCILFMPAYEGLENFVDKYGNSVIDDPTEEQAEFIGRKVGAKQYIQDTIDHLKSIGDTDGLADFQREHPTTYAGCFRTNGRNSFFNIPKVEDRIEQLREMKGATVPGYFKWEGPKFRSRVRFVPDHENPKFQISKQLSYGESNRVTFNQATQSYEALNIMYCAGADPFKANETKSKKSSLGGGAVFYGHDINKDPFEKPVEEWVTNHFVCTYLWKGTDKDEYNEDMIMMCMYYGCPLFIETNVQDLKDACIKLGFKGMLVHRYDVATSKIEEIAGQATSTKVKHDLFKLLQHYVNKHIHKEKHIQLLEQIRDIMGLDEMTKYDLFTAAGYAMLGFEQYGMDIQMVIPKQEAIDHDEIVEEFSY